MHTPDLFLDAHATLGEGPVWHPRRRQLLWVDIQQHVVHVTDPLTADDRTLDIGEHVGCVVPASGSLAVVGLQSGFAFVDLDTGAIAPIHDPEAHLPGNRFNDGKCDPAGRLWAGTMALDETPGAGALYCLDEALTVTRKVGGVSVSNGLAWSLDETTMFFVDSPTCEVAAYDYDRSTGDIANRRVVYEFADADGFPDGMTIDREGCLWVAMWNGSKVVRVDPRAGRAIETIAMPTSRPTSCAFGGEDYADLYITSASNMPDAQRARQPLAGGVFRCRPRVAGMPPIEFAGGISLPS